MGGDQDRLEEGVQHILLITPTDKAQYSHVVSEEFLLENIHPSTVDEDKLH